MNRWRLRRFCRWHRLQLVVLVAALLSQLLVSLGLPLPAVCARLKDTSTPYPCMDHPCGCLSAEQCWACACCCFSMTEKLAWAAEHHYTPPPSAYKIAAEEAHAGGLASPSCCPECNTQEQPQTASCCAHAVHQADCCHSTTLRGVVVVLGISALRCQGQAASGLLASLPAVPPVPPLAGLEQPTGDEMLPLLSLFFPSLLVTPPTPPPRSA